MIRDRALDGGIAKPTPRDTANAAPPKPHSRGCRYGASARLRESDILAAMFGRVFDRRLPIRPRPRIGSSPSGGAPRSDDGRNLKHMSTSRPSPDEVRAATADTARFMTPQNVPVNAYESRGAFVVVAPFPALTEKDVSVELTAGGVRF